MLLMIEENDKLIYTGEVLAVDLYEEKIFFTSDYDFNFEEFIDKDIEDVTYSLRREKDIVILEIRHG